MAQITLTQEVMDQVFHQVCASQAKWSNRTGEDKAMVTIAGITYTVVLKDPKKYLGYIATAESFGGTDRVVHGSATVEQHRAIRLSAKYNRA
jgi:hypothetical protein